MDVNISQGLIDTVYKFMVVSAFWVLTGVCVFLYFFNKDVFADKWARLLWLCMSIITFFVTMLATLVLAGILNFHII